GGFGWPVPDGGTKASFTALDRFYGWYAHTTDFIAPAYPRFQDIYAQAGTQKSWGSIDDQAGKTYIETLTRALRSRAPIIQIATWNDWGEGTQIEPSVEFGYRDLEATQRLRKKYIDPSFPYTPQDLRLPARLYELRKRSAGNQAIQARLDRVSAQLEAGETRRAGKLLAQIGKAD
ncbi:MAG TPA: glycoside hydrolase family 99-like domain-containing protein, partial [Capsulimonadaceae bacterium]|nr:glycoside hydrolase family 99-like domain-containing protein [Capsulimonadaceae bacterium]